jgi:beta-lactamase superfamily II metal-dependent hydrolase
MPPRRSKHASIRIRMYRVGFGDCFLISLKGEAGAAHILVDCGVHFRGDIETIEQAVEDIARETDRKLAIVIATHAHQDHVSGFAKCAGQFKSFSIGEVWLPWTEDPADAQATTLRRKQAALAQRLNQHFAATGNNERALFAVQNLVGNREALKLLRSGINGGTVRYLQAGVALERPAEIEGLTARIFGPPREEKFLIKMDPPRRERFLRLGAFGQAATEAASVPFDKQWWVPGATPPLPDWALLQGPEKDALERMLDDAEALAFFLDRAMNNTSIVALLSYRGHNLLFPGDAQYGNWSSWIDGPEAADILEQVSFYKVSHHGSFNATPRSVLERLPEGRFAAMVSTQSEPWASIPQVKIMTALQQAAGGVVRSDCLHVDGAPGGPRLDELPSGFGQGQFWFDYEIPA